MLLGQFNFDKLGTLDSLQGSGQILWGHLQTYLIVLRGHTIHLVLIEEVGLQRGQNLNLNLFIEQNNKMGHIS